MIIRAIYIIILLSPVFSKNCDFCNSKIEGQYLVLGNKEYHEKCYKQNIIPKCAICKKSLEGQYVVHKGKEYHEDCYNTNVLPKCGFCNKTLYNQYIVHENQNYHDNCYKNNILPKCSVCNHPLETKYMIDSWSNQYHEAHESETGNCNSCGRIISKKTSNSGYKLSDNRLVCGICMQTKIETSKQIENARDYVLKLLDKYNLNNFPNDVPIELKNRKQLSKLRGRESSEIRGFTYYNYLYDSRSGNVDESSKTFKIYILDNLPELEFKSVLAHEYLHVWLHVNNLDYHSNITEGFCNLAAALVYQDNIDDRFSEINLDRMLKNTDPDYGEGYRRIKSCLDKHGWRSLIKRMKKNNLSCFYK